MAKQSKRRPRRDLRGGLGSSDAGHIVKAEKYTEQAWGGKMCAASFRALGRAEAHIESIEDRITKRDLERVVKRTADIIEAECRNSDSRRF